MFVTNKAYCSRNISRSEAIPKPLTTLETPLFDPRLQAVIEAILQQHGTILERKADGYTLTFPEGTVSIELYPRAVSERYRLVYPDAYTLYVIQTRKGITYLSFPKDDIPEALRDGTHPSKGEQGVHQ